MLDAKRENLLAVMALLTQSTEEAATEKLAARVWINAAETDQARALAHDLTELLGRSLNLTADAECDIEVAVGTGFKSNARTRINVSVNPERALISLGNEGGHVEDGVHGLFRKIAACYISGNVIARAVGGPKFEHLPDPFEVKFSAFGVSNDDLRRPIMFNDAVVAGAGGVANGFFWGASELDLSGTLIVCDPKTVRAGNLNRCLYFHEGDIGQNKAELLAERASNDKFKVKPVIGTVADVVQKYGKVRRVLTTVDSREARRTIQSELPLEVLDASTTDLTAIVIHSHRQPTDGACLACVYAHIPVEDQRQKHVAEGLGISIDEAGQSFIDGRLAAKLASIHNGLDAAALVGKSLDTLYKEQCGQGVLLTSAGEQAIAPLAFISNLAGALLALELVRFEARAGNESIYMSLDPWRPPTLHARRHRGKNPDCEFCADPVSLQAMQVVWPEIEWPDTAFPEAGESERPTEVA